MKKFMIALIILIGLIIETSCWAIPFSSTVQFNSVEQKWNSAGTSIPNMPYIASIISIGKYNFAFGCTYFSDCQPDTITQSLVSFNSGSGWRNAQAIPAMDKIVGALFYPNGPKNSSMGWILGIQSNPSKVVFSYFNGQQFSPAADFPAISDSTVNGEALAVSHQKFWVFNGVRNQHNSYWTTDTYWHVALPYPGNAYLIAVTTDDISNDVYLLQSDGMINHMLTNETWDTPIYFPKPVNSKLTDMRVANNGKIIYVLVELNSSQTHVYISQNGGGAWKDLGVTGNRLNNLSEVLNGNTKNILWEQTQSSIRYFDPSIINADWIEIPITAGDLKLKTSLDGTQAWLYGTNNNQQVVAYYYDINLRKFIFTNLSGMVDHIDQFEASANGKAFGFGTYQSAPSALYFNGSTWIKTELQNVNMNIVRLSHLPLGFAALKWLDNRSAFMYKEIVDPDFQNVWIYNLS